MSGDGEVVSSGGGVRWYRRHAFWVWSRIFGGLILGGVVSIIMAIGLKSWPMVGFGGGFIAVGVAFAVVVALLTRPRADT